MHHFSFIFEEYFWFSGFNSMINQATPSCSSCWNYHLINIFEFIIWLKIRTYVQGNKDWSVPETAEQLEGWCLMDSVRGTLPSL